MSDPIDEGDKVFIHIDARGEVVVEGYVKHVPVATGDSWIIESGTGIVYVQQFHAMWKQK